MAARIRKPRKKRVPRPVEKDVVVGYDSTFEYELHQTILDSWDLHSEKIQYTVSHTYTPDFMRVIDGKTILLEAKGRFWDYPEFSKYLWIQKALKENEELVFLFANPSAPMPQAKRRKDGTKRSHGEWASANGFRWFSKWSMPDDWINLKKRDDLDEY
jgi:hypothetical protein